MTLDTLSIDDFLPLVSSNFKVIADNVDLSLELIEAKPIKVSLPNAPRQGFSLLFKGVNPPQLEQQIVRLEHVALGVLEIFLVPIGLDAAGVRYEAIFN